MHTNGITKRLVSLGLSALGLYAIMSLFGTSNAPAAGSIPTSPVMVVNTTAIPVVQQGTATVSGNLTVANAAANPVPVVQQGPVSISAGSSVKVTADSPLAVTAPGQIVRISAYFELAGGTDLNLYTVPTGKRLLINYVSADGRVTDGNITCSLFVTTLGGDSLGYSVGIPIAEQPLAGGGTILKASVQAEIVVNTGESLQGIFSKDSPTSAGYIDLLAIGTLVDATDTTIDVFLSN
jgi:hypothetical protein